MLCRCKFPIAPSNKSVRQGLFRYFDKEIPNISDYVCPICGAKYTLRGFQDKTEIIKFLGETK